jgi:hypothetical protein
MTSELALGVGPHMYDEDDRCICGGLIVWFDYPPIGNGCEVEGKPWAPEVRLKDPAERKADNRAAALGQIYDPETGRYVYA